MKRSLLYIMWGLAACVVVLAVLMFHVLPGAADQNSTTEAMIESTSGEEARPITVSRVERLENEHVRQYPGATRSCLEAELAFRVDGPLVAVEIQPGSYVESGQLLMQIDPRDYEDNVRMLEAQLAGAVAAKNAAALDLRRLSTLLEQDAVSQSDYDDLKTAYDSSVASVQAIEAQLSIARHQLEDTSLTSPFSGVVTGQFAENHEMVAAGQVVVKMQDLSELEIDVSVPENEMPLLDLENGQIATVTFASMPGREFEARLKEWSAEVDSVTKTYTVTFVLPAPEDARMLPGMTVQVSWTNGDQGQGALSIPASAVIASAGEGSTVWVYDSDSNTASQRAVTTGALVNHSHILVLDGLSEGEMVVTAGMDFITQGMLLRPLESL
ncbi:MAG: efflux RND transporter periplasmic adaptor subunit [Desulfovibrio sp.]|mgnify:CR=1 FL=1|nr:MAG: efflux RND transporter periplasmic adaptor subunit [Desulfovibrio sp.]